TRINASLKVKAAAVLPRIHETGSGGCYGTSFCEALRWQGSLAPASIVHWTAALMNILDVVVGKPIKTRDERAEQIGPAQGVPIFGLDGLSSAAYGPEAALSLLLPLGHLGVRYIVPISAAIITLLVIVYFSYRQTIAAYPSGGGAYTVARFNLGAPAGLLAASALLADYILTAAVGI